MRKPAPFARVDGTFRQRPYLWAAGLTMLVVLAFGWGTAYALYRQEVALATEIAAARARSVAEEFKSFLEWQERGVHVMTELPLERVSSQGEFDRAVSSLAQNMAPGVVLQWAPAGVVRYIHPLSGNEPAIGHDLRKDPERWALVERIIGSGMALWAGPYALKQGGLGMILRVPVYRDRKVAAENFLGLAITLIRFPEGLKTVMAAHSYHAYRVWVSPSGPDGKAGEPVLVWGDAGDRTAQSVPSGRFSLDHVTLGLPGDNDGPETATGADGPNTDQHLAVSVEAGPVAFAGWSTLAVRLAVIAVIAALLGWLAGYVSFLRRRQQEADVLSRRVIEVLPDSLNLKDASGRFLIANEATAKLHQASSAADLIGKTDFDFYPRDVAEQFLADERELLADGVPRVIEQEAMLKDGRCVFLSTLKVPLRDSSGTIRGLVTHNRDITTRKDAEAARDELLAATSDLIQRVGVADGRIVYVNPSWCRRLGYSADEVIGLDFFPLIHPDDRDHCSTLLGAMRAGDAPRRVEFSVLARDGQRVPLEGEVTVWKDRHGQLSTRGVFRDISSQKQAEARKNELLLLTASDGIHVLDLAGNVVQASDSFARMLGYDREEVLKLNIRDWEVWLSGAELEAGLAAFEDPDFSRVFETVHRRRDGSTYVAELSARSVNVDGRKLIYASARDISARKRAEQAVRESEEKFRALFDHAPDAFLLMDSREHGRIVACNKAAMALLRCGADAIIGRTPADFSPLRQADGQLSSEAAVERFGTVMEQGNHTFNWQHRRADGEVFWAEVRCSVLPHSDRSLMIIAWRDISERIEAQRVIGEQNELLKRSNADLEQFAYVASHDLKEPLRAVSGFAQMLATVHGPKLEGSARELIGHVVDGAGRMQALINDLLAFSRLAQDDKPRAPVGLDGVLDEALRNLDSSVQETGAVILRDALPAVLAERTQMLQLFQNLIGNALKFRGERRPEIRILAEHLPQFWKIGVRDNGIGIAGEYAGRIFKIFQRLHTREVYPGTGIGLAICQRIVERHGGRIWVESAPGEGSTFFFTIPDVATIVPSHRKDEDGSQ